MPNARPHWRAERAAVTTYRNTARILWLAQTLCVRPLWKCAEVKLTWYYKEPKKPRKPGVQPRHPDGDNFAAAMKCVIDAAQDDRKTNRGRVIDGAGIIQNDRNVRWLVPDFAPGVPGVRVTLSWLPEDQK